jgi:hypothetical protein
LDYRSLHHFSRRSLKGRYFRALKLSWFLLLLRLLYRLLPAGLAVLLAARGGLPGGWLWGSFLLLWMLFWEGMMLPVRCAVWKHFGAWLGLTSMRICFRNVREYAFAARVLGLAGLLRLLGVLPMTAAGMTAILLLRAGAGHPDAGWYLFWAVQAFAVMLWAAFLTVRLRVSLSAVPLLCTESPQGCAVSVIRQSFRLTEGQHAAIWSIVLCYLPAMLTVVPMLFLLPRLYADMTLFLQLRIRELSQNGG